MKVLIGSSIPVAFSVGVLEGFTRKDLSSQSKMLSVFVSKLGNE